MRTVRKDKRQLSTQVSLNVHSLKDQCLCFCSRKLTKTNGNILGTDEANGNVQEPPP